MYNESGDLLGNLGIFLQDLSRRFPKLPPFPFPLPGGQTTNGEQPLFLGLGTKEKKPQPPRPLTDEDLFERQGPNTRGTL